MSEKSFNPAPGWPVPPAGWTPPPGWQPDPSWPAAPLNWPLWVDKVTPSGNPNIVSDSRINMTRPTRVPVVNPTPAPVIASTSPTPPRATPFQTQQNQPPQGHNAQPFRAPMPPQPQVPQQPQFNQQPPRYMPAVQAPMPQAPQYNMGMNQQPPRRRGGVGIIILSITTAILAIISLVIGVQVASLSSQNAELQRENTQLVEENQTQSELLDAREGFMVVLYEANETIANAESSIDVSTYRSIVDSAKEAAFDERYDPSYIVDQQTNVEQVISDVKDEVAAWEANNNRKAEGLVNRTGTQAEASLDAISGGTIEIALDNACPMDTLAADSVAACVMYDDPYTVHVQDNAINNPYISSNQWTMLMLHEYAHTVQFRSWSILNADPTFTSLFDKNIELHADCMARAAYGENYESGYQFSCTQEQIDAAGKAWDYIDLDRD